MLCIPLIHMIYLPVIFCGVYSPVLTPISVVCDDAVQLSITTITNTFTKIKDKYISTLRYTQYICTFSVVSN